MNSLWDTESQTWNNTPDNIRKKIQRDTILADIQSEEELLK